VSYNNLRDYTASLYEALTVPYAPYEKIGLREDDDYRQLNTTLLQIENEFYSSIRPKRRIKRGERPLHALRERGVEYVEVRCMDLDPFEPVGISAQTMNFLDVFLMHCLLSDSPPDTPAEIGALARNQQRVAARGRESGLMLERTGGEVSLADWGAQILRECEAIAEALDAQAGGNQHREAVLRAWKVLDNPDTAPSARVLAAMAGDFDSSYIAFTRAQSQQTKAGLLALPYSDQLHNRFTRMAQESIDEQRRIEAADTLPFELYRQQYLSVERLGLPGQRAAA
jgi:glutamate--cysteine ligase